MDKSTNGNGIENFIKSQPVVLATASPGSGSRCIKHPGHQLALRKPTAPNQRPRVRDSTIIQRHVYFARCLICNEYVVHLGTCKTPATDVHGGTMLDCATALACQDTNPFEHGIPILSVQRWGRKTSTSDNRWNVRCNSYD